MNSSPTTDVFGLLRRALPVPVKSALRPAWSRGLRLRFRLRYGFPPPPPPTDLVGYEGLIDFICSRELLSIPGDIVEIGAFRGGGTYKLAKFLQRQGSQKKVYTVDCFDIQVDQTENTDGRKMAELYEEELKGKNQRQVFDSVTAGNPNIVVIAGDSKVVDLPTKAVCFGFVDGNHATDYVVNDFYFVWKTLSPGGAIALHDYGYDLPNVTTTIDLLCARHSSEISAVHVDDRHHIIYIRKAAREGYRKELNTMADKTREEVSQLLKPVGLPPLPDNPLVSLLTANYNYAGYLREAIESALGQTYANFEMIVCDDGSTDKSCEVAERYAERDSRIKLLRKENGGVSSALNAAYRESKGEIICLLDADDRFLPEKLERVVTAFRSHPDSGFLGHRMFLIDAEGRRRGLKPLFANHPSGWFGPNVVRHGDFPSGLSFGSGLCLRREISNLIFPLPERFRSGADGVIMALGPLMTPIVGINVPLTEYREHGKNVTNTAHVTLDFLERDLQLLRMYSELRNEYLRGVDPRLSEVSPKFDELMETRSSIYIQERLKKGNGSLSAYRKFVRAEGFRGIHPVLRWFWRCSILLPRPLFRHAVNEALRPRGVKQFVWRAVRSRPSGIMTRLRQA